mmetsp:Transcript_88028/g.139041  ORF Transcript_88028/g.139041 Transcript_88028/m.139041 type:complete len:384 (-) Transcript_88028:33-1184(-)
MRTATPLCITCALTNAVALRQNVRRVLGENPRWFPSHYEALGVSKDATEEQLTQAYYKRILLFHSGKADAQTANKFREVQEAYEALKDPVKRYDYDTGFSLSEALQSQLSNQKSQVGYYARDSEERGISIMESPNDWEGLRRAVYVLGKQQMTLNSKVARTVDFPFNFDEYDRILGALAEVGLQARVGFYALRCRLSIVGFKSEILEKLCHRDNSTTSLYCFWDFAEAFLDDLRDSSLSKWSLALFNEFAVEGQSQGFAEGIAVGKSTDPSFNGQSYASLLASDAKQTIVRSYGFEVKETSSGMTNLMLSGANSWNDELRNIWRFIRNPFDVGHSIHEDAQRAICLALDRMESPFCGGKGRQQAQNSASEGSKQLKRRRWRKW